MTDSARGAPDRLRCEYLDDPLGIGTARPRLSWWLNDRRAAELQSGYHLQAASSAAALAAGDADLWDTGHVPSQQTCNIEYRGRELRSGQRVWWRVRCYDSDGTPSAWSEPGRFELAILDAAAWQGRWIAAPLAGSPATAVPAPLLYRDFDLAAPPLAVRWHVSVLGSARVEINGQPVTAAEPLEPWLQAARQTAYRVWDVGPLVRPGRNRVAVILGDGVHCGHLAGGPRQQHRLRPAICGQLVAELPGGRTFVLGTDSSWRWRPSWMLRADRDGGDEVDGRQRVPGWSEPGTELGGSPVAEHDEPAERVAHPVPPPRAGAAIDPLAEPERRRDGGGPPRLRYDFGRTLLGRVRLELEAPRDAVVTVRYGLPATDDDGAAVVGWEPAVDRYTAHGGGRESFEAAFAVHAFRFVEVAVDRGPHAVAALTAHPIAAAAAPAASFSCDHRLVEGLFRAAGRTLEPGLALGPVSGLPIRRRLAEPADGEAIAAAAVAGFDVAAGLAAWLAQQAAEQHRRGPLGGSAMAMRSSQLPCLWLHYRCYGDRRLLEALYPAVQAHLAAAGAEESAAAHGTERPADQMIATAWHGYELSLAARMAGVLGRVADLDRCERAAAALRERFRYSYLTRQGLLVADDQLGYLLALELGLLEGQERLVALERLEAQLRRRGFHLETDLRHGPLMLEVLTLEGRLDLAYQLLLQTTAPGWLHPLTADSAVLADERLALPGRLAAAGVAGWLQRFLLGLEVDHDLTPEWNAYRRVRVQPRPPLGPAFAAGPPIREAAGHLDTVHGRYECGWRITGKAFELSLRVPGNGSARVVLPDGSERLVVAGAHEFSVPLAAAGTLAGDGIPVLSDVSADTDYHAGSAGG